MKTTIITLAYNHNRYIREALSSAIAQTRPADEIIVIDDASLDGTAEAIGEFVNEHPRSKIIFIRNERNLGVTASFAKALEVASGDIIIGMAGDDVSSPSRVARCVAYFSEHPGAMALVANADIIDAESRPVGVLDNCAGRTEPVALSLGDLPEGAYFLRGRSSCGAASAYRAEVFRAFSPLRAGLYAEDDPAAFRAMLLGTCNFLPEPLVCWRRHANNLSHGAGSRRGPEMAIHYRRCEAMIDQMLSDMSEWALKHPEAPLRSKNALTNLSLQKARWSLWAAAHEEGINVSGFLFSARQLWAHCPTWSAFIAQAWRPFVGMLTPYSFQRFLARHRQY